MTYSFRYKFILLFFGFLLCVSAIFSQTITGTKCVSADGITVYDYEIGNWNYNNEVMYVNVVGGHEINAIYGGSSHSIGDGPVQIHVVFTDPANPCRIELDLQSLAEDPQYPGTYTQQQVGSAILPINENKVTNDVINGDQSINYSISSTPITSQTNINGTGSGYSFIYSWEQGDNYFGTFLPTGITTPQFNIPNNPNSIFLRRKVTQTCGGYSVYSNVVKISWVSNNWENINYVREFDILKPGIANFAQGDGIPIGEKLANTTYLDGLGRPVQKIDRGVVDIQPTNNQGYGDAVQFFNYDGFGRQPKQYLSYTTTADNGKFKTDPVTDQAQYYSTRYNETSPYSPSTYDNSPLNRVLNIKSSGSSWAAGLGNSIDFDVNTTDDNVQIFTIGFNSGDIPYSSGAYLPNTLFKTVHIDESNIKSIEYTNKLGQVILKKTESAGSHTDSYDNWICIYNVYDDYGLLRYVFQPEAVKWLASNKWSFNNAAGPGILDELCFRYEYDERRRTVLKKAPGAKELFMVYDARDRVVFTQDGNQRAKTPGQWTVNLYDELDKPVITALYATMKTKTDLGISAMNAVTTSTVTTITPGDAINDLVVNKRITGISVYAAQNSISFEANNGGSFTSNDGDEFTAAIVPGTSAPPTTVSATLFKSPITSAELNNPAVITIVKYFFYDDYTYAGAKPFNTNSYNTVVYPSGGDPIVASKRTLNIVTGKKVRVLGTNKFLTTSYYYDEKGRSLQTTQENIKDGQDIITRQYKFDGTVLSLETKHSTANSGYDNYSFISKYSYDRMGRLTLIDKYSGQNSTQLATFTSHNVVAGYEYDDMGRLLTKNLYASQQLSPVVPNSSGDKAGIETLRYSYNIHGQMTGINKDYALKTPGKYTPMGHYFGMYIGYDNSDHVFTKGLLDGHVSGMIWSNMGDQVQRRYDFSYDNAGRLSNALYSEKPGINDSWSNAQMDFSLAGNEGINSKIAYDLNGNLQKMTRRGVLTGSTTPLDVDKLSYSYGNQGLSNKLTKVKDNGNLGVSNGKLGDFSDGSNADNDDYTYDENGNLVVDLNKGITTGGLNGKAINYNYLDKPEEIHIAGKGVLKILYDADGNKLQKTFTPEGGQAAVTTSYMQDFVYQGDDLQFINFEEGRRRLTKIIHQSSAPYDGKYISTFGELPPNNGCVYDFFIRDYLGNVRAVITDEYHFSYSTCTMETGRAAKEEPVFGKVDANGVATADNEVKARFPVANIPGQANGNGWQSNTSNYVSQLGNLVGQKIGPNVLLKVMAGDEIGASVKAFYKAPVSNQDNGASLVNDVVSSFIQAVAGSSVVSGVHTLSDLAGVGTQLTNSVPFNSITDPDNGNAIGTSPKAYLTVLFFDEQFKFIPPPYFGMVNSQRVAAAGDNAPQLLIENIVPKNGYAFVYASNSSDETVYFDDFAATFTQGSLVEDNHYYPFGLKMAGISSHLMADQYEMHIDNQNLYNDKELLEDGGLNWYDYGFRNYDPQIGRFPQLDPLTNEYPYYTPYQYAGNEPIANIDIDGLEPLEVTAFANSINSTAITTLSAGRYGVSWIEGSGIVAKIFKPQHLLSTVLDGIVKTGTTTEALIDQMEKVKLKMRTPMITQISERQMKGYNFWHEWTQIDPGAGALDGALNPISKTFQQLLHNVTGQTIIRNLDGSAASYSNSRSQSDVDGRIVDFTATMSSFAGSGGGVFGATKEVLNPREINFMQSNIKNATGEFTVLGNAQALKSGALNPEVLRMNIWKDASGKIWTLDHRRLAAFRLSGLQEAPIQWANPSGQMWKMTTTNGGSSIWLKFGGGNGATVR